MSGRIYRLLLVIAAALLPHPALAEKITLGVAASTVDAVRQVVARFMDETAIEEDSIRISVAASSAIARQIEAGAPIALFLSANASWVDYLAQRGYLAPESRIELLGNRLTIVSPRAGAQPLPQRQSENLSTWLGEQRFALADPSHVPAGMYGKAALISRGEWDGLKNKLVLGASVRDVLMMVARGDVGAGLVYHTDALISDDVHIITAIDPKSHPPVRYTLALISRHDTSLARRFHNFLRSSTAGDIFRRYGFIHTSNTRPGR
jgi:molybdate transport system substrate-binding protein